MAEPVAEAANEAVEAHDAETAAPAYSAVVEIAQPVPETAVAELAEPETATATDGDNAPVEDMLLVSIPEESEAELLEIFLEEANEVLATLGEACEACQSNPDDQASLTVIRRGFHTLKGSGRMVGLNELGETAWRHEQLMNGWLAEKKPASGDLLRLVGRARGVFQDWVNALQANQSASLPVPALLAAVDRVAQGQPLDVAPVPAAAAVEHVAEAPAANAPDLSETVAEAETVVETDVAAVPEVEAVAAVEVDVAADAEAESDWLALSATEPVVEHEDAFTALETEATDDAEAVAAETLVELAGHAGSEANADVASIMVDDVQPEAEAARFELPVPEVGAIIEYAAPVASSDIESAAPGRRRSTARGNACRTCCPARRRRTAWC